MCFVSAEKAGRYFANTVRALSPKVTLFFPFFLLFVFPRHRRAAESHVAAANDRPAADIDRRGGLSLQEANNKAEVKIHPAKQPLHLLVFMFIQGCAPGDPECPWKKKKNLWIWWNLTYNSRPFSGCSALSSKLSIHVRVCELSHSPRRMDLPPPFKPPPPPVKYTAARRRDVLTESTARHNGTIIWKKKMCTALCISHIGNLQSAHCAGTRCVEETESLEWKSCSGGFSLLLAGCSHNTPTCFWRSPACGSTPGFLQLHRRYSWRQRAGWSLTELNHTK